MGASTVAKLYFGALLPSDSPQEMPWDLEEYGDNFQDQFGAWRNDDCSVPPEVVLVACAHAIGPMWLLAYKKPSWEAPLFSIVDVEPSRMIVDPTELRKFILDHNIPTLGVPGWHLACYTEC